MLPRDGHHRRSRAARRPAERSGGGPDRRQDRVRQPAVGAPAFRSSRSRPSSARNGCRRWRTRPTSSPASRGGPACDTRRSCRTLQGSSARTRPASRRSRSSPPRRRPSAAGTSIRAIDASLDDLSRRSASGRRTLGMRVRAYVSTAFGCPFEGRRPSGTRRARSPQALVEMGAFEVAVSDTIGIAHPGQIPAVVDAVAARVPLAADRAALSRHARHGARERPHGAADWASRLSIRRRAGSADVPTRRARPATSPPRISIYMLDGLGIETGVNLAAVVEASAYIEPRVGHRLPSRYYRAVKGA